LSRKFFYLSRAHDMSGSVAHDLSGLLWSPTGWLYNSLNSMNEADELVWHLSTRTAQV